MREFDGVVTPIAREGIYRHLAPQLLARVSCRIEKRPPSIHYDSVTPDIISQSLYSLWKLFLQYCFCCGARAAGAERWWWVRWLFFRRRLDARQLPRSDPTPRLAVRSGAAMQ